MKNNIPLSEDAALIDKVGKRVVRDHFGVSDQQVYMWRRRGIPVAKVVAFANLARVHGVTVPSALLARVGLAA